MAVGYQLMAKKVFSKSLFNIVSFNAIILCTLLLTNVAMSHTIILPPPPPGPFPAPPPCPTGQCSDCSGPGTDDSIVFRSGRESTSKTDIVVNGVQAIKLRRVYSSDTFFDSPLGYGWAFNFNKRLFEYPDASVVIRHGCGHLNRFIYSANAYQPTEGSQNLKIKKLSDSTYTVKYPNGEWDNFDTQGRMISSYDIKGNHHDYIYDSRGNLPLIGSTPNALDPSKPIKVAYMPRMVRIEQRLADGNSLTGSIDLAYNDITGRLISATANDGRVITYQHDDAGAGLTKGNLIQVNGLESNVSTYKYEDKVGDAYQDHHNLTYKQEGTDKTPVVIEYNAEDQAFRETIGYKVVTLDYSELPLQTTVTETITDSTGANPVNAVSVYGFDILGFVEFERNALGHEKRYTLDGFGNKLQEKIYAGNETTGTLLKTIDRSYDANNNVLSEAVTLISGEIITTAYTYDGNQKASETIISSLTPTKIFKTEWIYNHDTNGVATTVLEERRYKDNGTDYLATAYTYNNNGDVLTTTLPDAHVVVNEYGAIYGGQYVTKTYHQIAGVAVTNLEESYTYDGQGNRTTVTDAKNNTTTTTYDALNRRKTVTNHLGHLTSYTYDARGNLKQISRDRTTVGDQLDITKLSYNGNNNLLTVERTDATGSFVVVKQSTYNSANSLISSTNSFGQTNQLSYDLLQRLNGITNYKSESISYTLDTLGNRTHEEVKNSSGVVVRSSDASYDALNRQLTQVGATNSQTTTYAYDAQGNRTSMVDALARPTTEYTYNALNQLANVKDASGNNTVYGYHDRGWLQTVTDPRSLAASYIYNDLGQLTNLVSPDTGATVYTYDLAGNKKTKRDARNITATYNYDDLNRLISISYPDATKNVTFNYDDNTGGKLNGLGKLTSINDESGSAQLEYNHWGDLIKETKIISGNTFVTTYNYDTEHRLSSIIYPSGRVVTHTADANKDIATLQSTYTTNNQTLLSNIQYMPFGGIDNASLGNGLALNNDYDADYRLTTQQAGSAYDRTTVYNDVNNITGIINNLDATRTQGFTYDDMDRLTDANGIYGAVHYEYDTDGNRTLETKDGTQSSTYNYPATSNKLDDITGTKANAYGYDANGNTETKNGLVFSYDQTNRMSQAVNGAVTTNYTYDGKGQRVSKDVNGVKTIYIFDKDGKLIAEANASGVVQKDYVYFAGKPVAMATTGASPTTYYYHVDHLGTPQVLTNQAQSVVWSGDYDVFGEVTLTTGVVENNLRFPGQYYDAESGLHYNYYRDYDPSLGRYVESDPIGLGGGVNTYAYVVNNPVLYYDYFGLYMMGQCDAAMAAINQQIQSATADAYADFDAKIEKADERYGNDEGACVNAWNKCSNSDRCPPPSPKDCQSSFKKCQAKAKKSRQAFYKSADTILSSRLKAIGVLKQCPAWP